MTTAFPGRVDGPVLLFLLIVLAARLRWFAASRLDGYFNITLTLMAITRFISEPVVDRWISGHCAVSITTMQQIALCMVPSQSAEFMAIAMLLAGAPVAEVARRHRRHRLIAVGLALTMFLAATRARHLGLRLEQVTGWDEVVAWLAFCIMPALLAFNLFRLLFGDLPRPRKDTAHLIVLFELAALAFVAGVDTFMSFVLALAEQLGLAHTIQFRLDSHSRTYLGIMLATTGLAAGPCVKALAARLQLDRKGRLWRKLRPLWNDLTSVLPNTVLSTERPRRLRAVTDFHLHRAAVEIRDVVLFLNPYLAPPPQDHLAALRGMRTNGDDADDRIAMHALALAAAVHAAQRTNPVKASGSANTFRSPSRTLDDELTELLGIAAWWPKAKDVTASRSRAVAEPAG